MRIFDRVLFVAAPDPSGGAIPDQRKGRGGGKAGFRGGGGPAGCRRDARRGESSHLFRDDHRSGSGAVRTRKTGFRRLGNRAGRPAGCNQCCSASAFHHYRDFAGAYGVSRVDSGGNRAGEGRNHQRQGPGALRSAEAGGAGGDPEGRGGTGGAVDGGAAV